MPTAKTKRRPVGDRYFELVRAFPLRPIRSDAELDQAIGVLNGLIDRGPSKRTADENDYMDVLGDLVEAYETATMPEPHITPESMLRGLMEDRGVKPAEFCEATGIGRSTLSEITTGKRPMTREHIEKAAAFFGVKPSVFLD